MLLYTLGHGWPQHGKNVASASSAQHVGHFAFRNSGAACKRFLQGGLKQIQAIKMVCVEISESRYDQVLLTVINTPGLDVSKGRELSVEHQVTKTISTSTSSMRIL